MNMLSNISVEMIGLAAIFLSVLLVICFLGCILGQLRKTNDNLEKIKNGILDYLNEVLGEENEDKTEANPVKISKKTHTKEEEEAFQAVMQEYFS